MGHFCNNEEDHRKEGREDFERHGYYDREKYHDHWNDCNQYYKQGYDQAERREEERREEQRQEERQQEMELRQDQARRERCQAEEDYYMQMNEQQYAEQSQPEPQQNDSSDDLPF